MAQREACDQVAHHMQLIMHCTSETHGLMFSRAISRPRMEATDYQVGAHFEALDVGILAGALKLTILFSHFNIPESAVREYRTLHSELLCHRITTFGLVLFCVVQVIRSPSLNGNIRD